MTTFISNSISKVSYYVYYINIDNASKKNKHVLFDIDWQGARKLRKKFSKNNKLKNDNQKPIT